MTDPVVASQLAQLPPGLDALILSGTHHKVDFTKDDYDPSGIQQVKDLAHADVTGSTLRQGRHMLLLDIDRPAWLVPSSTPGHSHLYVDLDTSWDHLLNFLRVAKAIGLIEKGFLNASEARGFTSLRLPWVKKEAVA